MSISFGGTTAMEIAKIPKKSKDLIEFVDDRKKDIAIVEAEIQEIEDEKSRLLIQANGISENMLIKISMILKATLNNAIEPSSVFLTIRLR